MPQRGDLNRIGIVVRGEREGRDTHADKRAERKIDCEIDQSDGNRRILARSGKQPVARTAEPFDHALRNDNEQHRDDKEPGAPLEGLPAEAHRRSNGEFHERKDSTQAALTGRSPEKFPTRRCPPHAAILGAARGKHRPSSSVAPNCPVPVSALQCRFLCRYHAPEAARPRFFEPRRQTPARVQSS